MSSFGTTRLKIFLCSISALAMSGMTVPAMAQGAPVEMHIDTAAAPTETIDRNIFGQFAEHLGQGI